MLQEFQFLNIVYNESSRVRKMLQKTSSNLNRQQQLTQQIDESIDQFMTVFRDLDDLTLYSQNNMINQDNCKDFLQRLAKIIIGNDEFLVVFEINKNVNGLCTKDVDLQQIHKILETHKESGIIETNDFQDIFGLGELYLYKNKYSYMVYPIEDMRFKLFTDFRLIIDQFISLIYDFHKEIYEKSTMINVLRGIKILLIQNSTRICQEIIRSSIQNLLNCKCLIEMPDQIEYMKDILIDQYGNFIMPVKLNQRIKYYIKIEQPCIDMITFTDYIQQLWQKLTYRLQELKSEEFLRQVLEVTSPNKLVICPVPQSWVFMIINGDTLEDIKMEQVNKNNIKYKIKEIQSTKKAAVNVGSIQFGDKIVDVDLYVRRDEEDVIQTYYLVFDQPKKVFDDQRMSFRVASESRLDNLAQGALHNMKNEKINKACVILRDYLKLDLTDDEIIDQLKEKDLIKEVYNNQTLNDDIRQSYAMEYYKTESHNKIREMSPEPAYQTYSLIAETQLTNIKKFELFSLDSQDISTLSDYSFDITMIQEPLEQIRYTWALFHLCNYIDQYQINKETFYNFLIVIRDTYNQKKNPFHNFDHGFTVAHACYHLIKSKSLHQYFENIVQFTALVSALCHDVDHSGRNNHFEVSSYSKLALRYNDESVLENHHAATTFKILKVDQNNFLSKLSSEQFLIFRKYTIQNILATDMKKHFEIIKQMELKLSKLPDEPLIQKEDDKKFLSGAIIHTCDLTGQTKKFTLAHKWSLKIQKEFSQQVEDEKLHSLPVTQHFLLNSDPNLTQKLAKQEIQFIKVIVQPCYELTAKILQQGLELALQNLQDNLKSWDVLVHQQNVQQQ
ncbi:hypothetical protein pb186bvf_001085 [Paramecium bursaria]